MEPNRFFKECPNCNNLIYYKTLKIKKNSEKKNRCCFACSKLKVDYSFNIKNNEIRMKKTYLKFDKETNEKIINKFILTSSSWKKFVTSIQDIIKEYNRQEREKHKKRNCPECNLEIKYNQKQDRTKAENKNTFCKSCAKKGNKNSFYGKKHTDESIIKMKNAKISSDSWNKFLFKQKTKEFRENVSKKMSGNKNPAYQRGSLYDVWEKKYGKLIAIEKYKHWLNKCKESAKSGEDNHMFGKPSPIGSGNGWSGWYKNWYFRSINELSYMINIIERFGFDWVSGESKKFKIEYFDWNGKKRNYFPDFILNNKYMIECKPKKLHKSVSVLCKSNAAKKYCESNGMIYKLVEPIKLSKEKMIHLYESGNLIFIEKYKEKFLNYFYNK